MKKSLLAAAAGAVVASVAMQAAASPLASMFSATGVEDDSIKVAQEAQIFADRQPDWARPFMNALYRDGEWGAVLNLNRLGLAAMEKQRLDIARRAFDQSIARVEAIYAEDANAEKARSVFNAEKVKDFKGEPYERAMMYYYRGLLYLQEGDYQNARAAFLAADRHDTLSSAEDKAFAGDFGLMKYLAGWASACDGETTRADQLIQEARIADASIRVFPEQPASSLVLIDAGPAPVKWGDGQYKQILRFKGGDGDDAAPALRTANGNEVRGLQTAGDVTYQATTRGGREVDGIMAGKAQFKDTANAVGDVAFSVSTHLMTNASFTGDRNSAAAGLAGLFIGLVAKGVERAASPEADVRAWDTLPARVLLYADNQIANSPMTLVSAGRSGALPLQGTHGACSFAWGRTRSALSAEMGGSANLNANVPAEANRGDRNRAFRSMLTTELVAGN